MRETRINKNTDVALLLMGSRLRAEMTVDEVAAKTGRTPESVFADESKAALIDELTVSDLVGALEATGSKVLVRQHDDGTRSIEDEVDELIELPVWKPGERRIIYMRSLSDSPHALRKARIYAGMTQARASELMGTSPLTGNISKHEAGKAVSLTSLFRYARVYNCEFVVGTPPEDD